MKTVNSISGGRTSAYMAMNYPAEMNVFMLVCIDDVRCKPKDDILVQRINERLERSGTIEHGEFIATAEFDKVLTTIFDLEQAMGREITWLRGMSFDKLIEKRKMVPKKLARFCTSVLKMDVIGNHLYPRMDEIDGVKRLFYNNVGIRYDEKERAKEGDDRFVTTKIHNGYHPSGRNKWLKATWGVANYPLIEDKISHVTVREYWKYRTDVTFSEDSNCIGCFWKPVQQLRKNWEDAPNKMRWFAEQEKKREEDSWKNETTYENISKLGLQKDFYFGTGSGCKAGYCTD